MVACWSIILFGSSRAAFTDLWQGLLVGIVFWPLAVGNAALAKVPPSVSINTSLFSPVAYLLLGSLPLLSVQSGSTAALCLGELLASRDHSDLAATAGLLAVLVGAMHFLMGLLDLGAAVELFSQPYSVLGLEQRHSLSSWVRLRRFLDSLTACKPRLCVASWQLVPPLGRFPRELLAYPLHC